MKGATGLSDIHAGHGGKDAPSVFTVENLGMLAASAMRLNR